MGVPEGHRCGVGVVDAFAPAGCPTHRSAGALHQEPNPRRGRPAPRTDTWRWQPELTASRPTAWTPYPGRITIVRRQTRETARHPGFLHPSGPPGGAVQPASQPTSCGRSRQHGPGCPPRLRQGCHRQRQRRRRFPMLRHSVGNVGGPDARHCSPIPLGRAACHAAAGPAAFLPFPPRSGRSQMTPWADCALRQLPIRLSLLRRPALGAVRPAPGVGLRRSTRPWATCALSQPGPAFSVVLPGPGSGASGTGRQRGFPAPAVATWATATTATGGKSTIRTATTTTTRR